MTKAYSYLRFSTPEQSKGDSMRRQSELAVKYADENGLELDTELKFNDPGVSAFRGANADTGRLGDFLRAVDGGVVAKGSYLLVESLDRISRSTARKALRILEDIIDRGITVVTLTDRRVYDAHSLNTDPTSLIMSILVFMRAHEESAIKSVRLKEVYNHKRQKARKDNELFTRRLPAWVRYNETTKAIELIPERAKVVSEIFELSEAGYGKDAIARQLNARGEPTFGRSTYWHRGYIHKILSNPACVGEFIPKVRTVVDGKLVKKPEEAIEGYFPKVTNEIRPIVKSAGVGQRRGNGGHMFSGLATCGLCGSNFVRVNKGKYTYLVCSKAHAKGDCEYLAVTYSQAEEAIVGSIGHIIREIPRGGDAKELENQIVNLEDRLDELRDDSRILAVDYDRTKSPIVRARIEKLEEATQEVWNELKEKRKQRVEKASGLVVRHIGRLQTAFKEPPEGVDARNVALRGVIAQMRFDVRMGLIAVQFWDGTWMMEGPRLNTRHVQSPFEAEG